MELLNKFKILTIGGSGLVGSRVNEILSQKYEVQDFSTKSGIDITQVNTLEKISNDAGHQYLILYAAKTDVDSCEKDKDLKEFSMAYKMNVLGVQNVVDAVKSSNKKLIYISTDFVFDGENTPKGGYAEEDQPHPVNWYAQTKYKGEEIIRNSGLPFIIIRIGYPYRKEFGPKKDFARAILARLQNNLAVTAVTDHIMTPTFIDDIGSALDILISAKQEGIFHLTGSQSLSPYEAAMLIALKFNLNKSLITPTTRSEFFKGRAPRPFNLTMNNDKIQKLGVKMKTFEEGLNFLNLTS
jgi:dTDP-4-dehydrorhamnose reductase